MGFVYAQYLWLLSGLPLVAVLLWVSERQRKRISETFRPVKFRKNPQERRQWRYSSLAYNGGMMLALALLIIALAGPYQNDKPVSVPQGPVQACFVVDVSRSMAAEDYRDHMPADAGKRPDLDSPWGSRLQMAKYQIGKMMDALPGNQLCLVTYTNHGFGQSILDDDLNALRFVLKHWVDIGTAPGDGSNYADGIDVALNILADSDTPAAQKVIILLSDGGFTGNAEELSKAVQRLKSEKVKLVIVGIGMPGSNAIPSYSNGVRKGVMEVEGKPLTTSYEEDAIRSLKAQTDAGYTHIALDANSQMVKVDWVTEITGTKIIFEKRRLDLYLAGAAYGLLTLIVLTGIFSRRSRLV
ncbi:MAG TPA: VWA domain-containing protein [Candidatus Melainabacteria bacterium]|nr:VWA domain-containing protein [Candidatus Melainabacteria bacterium]